MALTLCLATFIISCDDAKHEHSFSTEWKYDDVSHWHECECGARTDEGAHEVLDDSWKFNDKDFIYEGVCSICEGVIHKEIEEGVRIQGIAEYENKLFATANEAYDAIKAVLEKNGGLEQEELTEDKFKALFTNVDDNKNATVVWTIYGEQKMEDTEVKEDDKTSSKYFMTFGRKSSHYGDYHFSKVKFVGGNKDAKLVCSTLAFPYEWWNNGKDDGDSTKFEVSFENLVVDTNSSTFTLSQAYNNGLVASFKNCTFNGPAFNTGKTTFQLYNNAENTLTFENCTFSGGKYGLHVQGSGTEVTTVKINGCEFQNSRGVNIDQATAVATIENCTFTNCGNQTQEDKNNHHSAIQITRGSEITINNNIIKDAKGTAIYVRGNNESDKFKGKLIITNNVISNYTYAFCDLENGEHSLYTLTTSGNTITNTATTKCSVDGVVKDITAYLK